MELRDLELLVAVVDAGSITAGADRCGLSLSAASTRVSGLERRLGLRLLERDRRGVSPTPAGEDLTERAREILDRTRDLEGSIAARALGLGQQVRLATNSSAADALTEFLASTLTRLPGVAVTLTEVGSEAAAAQVLDGRADLAVVAAVPPGADCRLRPLWDDRLVVVGPRSAGPVRAFGLAQLLSEPVVGLLEGRPLQDLIDRRAREQGLRPVYRVRLPSLGAVCALATTGVGRAVVPLGSARRHGVPDAALAELAEPWAPRRALLLTRTDADHAPGAAAVIERLLAHAAEIE